MIHPVEDTGLVKYLLIGGFTSGGTGTRRLPGFSPAHFSIVLTSRPKAKLSSSGNASSVNQRPSRGASGVPPVYPSQTFALCLL